MFVVFTYIELNRIGFQCYAFYVSFSYIVKGCNKGYNKTTRPVTSLKINQLFCHGLIKLLLNDLSLWVSVLYYMLYWLNVDVKWFIEPTLLNVSK